MPEDKKDKAPKDSISEMIQKKFMDQRTITLCGSVEDDKIQPLIDKVLYLEAEDPGKEITFYINSPGGSVTSGLALYDVLKLVSSPIKTVVTGLAASMGSILLCAGDKGRRFILPHGRVLIHQPLIMGRMEGVAVDIHIHAQEMEKTREELNKILADGSGQKLEKIQKDTDRDFYLNAQEAIDYGFVDSIVDKI